MSAELLSTEAAARRLGISPQRVRKLIADGRLRSTRVGRDHIIAARDLVSVLDRRPGRPRLANTRPDARH